MKITVTGVSCNQCASSHSVAGGGGEKGDIHIASLQYFGLKVCRWTAEATADGDFVLTTAHGVKFALAGKMTPTSRAAQHVREDRLPAKQHWKMVDPLVEHNGYCGKTLIFIRSFVSDFPRSATHCMKKNNLRTSNCLSSLDPSCTIEIHKVLTLKHISHNTPETNASFQGYVSVKGGSKDHNSQHMSSLSEFSSVKAMTSFIMHYSAPS
ncbi:uncharacterized protein ACIBXB_020606 [Morphnus guianensis]